VWIIVKTDQTLTISLMLNEILCVTFKYLHCVLIFLFHCFINIHQECLVDHNGSKQYNFSQTTSETMDKGA